ncbi:hypothetical protein DV515_00019730, partial [Chloebia gouldiae]
EAVGGAAEGGHGFGQQQGGHGHAQAGHGGPVGPQKGQAPLQLLIPDRAAPRRSGQALLGQRGVAGIPLFLLMSPFPEIPLSLKVSPVREGFDRLLSPIP